MSSNQVALKIYISSVSFSSSPTSVWSICSLLLLLALFFGGAHDFLVEVAPALGKRGLEFKAGCWILLNFSEVRMFEIVRRVTTDRGIEFKSKWVRGGEICI